LLLLLLLHYRDDACAPASAVAEWQSAWLAGLLAVLLVTWEG
jgi:hypothetical protein